MNIDVSATDECFDCDKTFDIEKLYGICEECFEKRMLVELVDNALEQISSYPHPWEDKEFYSGFKNDEDKNIYLHGLRRGYFESLLHMAEFFGRNEYFENSIAGKFDRKEETE